MLGEALAGKDAPAAACPVEEFVSFCVPVSLVVMLASEGFVICTVSLRVR